MQEKFFINLLQEVIRYRETLQDLPVGVSAPREQLVSLANWDLPDEGETPEIALQALVAGVEKGLVNSISPRYFGFVIGGSTPASVTADWLTSLWDQNAQVYDSSPAASIIEDIVSQWLLDLLVLPKEARVGFVTGAQMANFTALTVARNAVLQKHGWNIEENGLQDSPHINMVCGECCHATVRSAISLMGLGNRNIRMVRADSEGRIDLKTFQKTLDACKGPTIVCAQAGNVNTGAFDPIAKIAALTKERGLWLHIDGAFGLWAGVSPRFKHLVSGAEAADSWATDAHKWLNVPYDSGIVIIRDSGAYQSFKTARCAYAGSTVNDRRDGSQWTPENSRRARGFVLYTALRNLGRKGVRQMVENCCDMAQLFAAELSRLPYARILNDVALNQVLCRIELAPPVNANDFNKSVAQRIQQAGVCWIGTTQWNGQATLRISVSNWATTSDDVHRSVRAIKDAVEEELKQLNS